MERGRMDKRKKIILIVAGIVLAAALIGILASGSLKDTFFEDLITETLDLYPYTLGLAHALDGSYLKYELNPNIPGFTTLGDRAWDDALGALKHINKELGFTPALYEKMTKTTEEMGVQTDSNKKFEVTWSYSSESGLYIIYERN